MKAVYLCLFLILLVTSMATTEQEHQKQRAPTLSNVMKNKLQIGPETRDVSKLGGDLQNICQYKNYYECTTETCQNCCKNLGLRGGTCDILFGLICHCNVAEQGVRITHN
uniref:Uncharacterized protein LOC114325352 n=1 Tax=Diabrotica virgifera virgifera TaxID=50390 RepID=A0A6P7F0V0_DIAVI